MNNIKWTLWWSSTHLIKSLVVIEPDLPCNKVDSCLLRCISFIKQTNMLLDFKGIPQVDETITSTSLCGISPTYISIKRLWNALLEGLCPP